MKTRTASLRHRDRSGECVLKRKETSRPVATKNSGMPVSTAVVYRDDLVRAKRAGKGSQRG